MDHGGAFQGNANLSVVRLPGSLSVIGDASFADDILLKRLEFNQSPAQEVTIGKAAFRQVPLEGDYTFNVRLIGTYAFMQVNQSGDNDLTLEFVNIQTGAAHASEVAAFAFEECRVSSLTFRGLFTFGASALSNIYGLFGGNAHIYLPDAAASDLADAFNFNSQTCILHVKHAGWEAFSEGPQVIGGSVAYITLVKDL